MIRTKPRTLSIGPVSSDTMRPEDLIPTLIWELDHIRLSRTERAQVLGISTRADCDEDSEYWQEEDASYDLDTLFDIMENHTPDYCYFGASHGDGACFGVWVSDDSVQDGIRSGEILVQSDCHNGRMDVIPTGYTGYVLRESDHGNQSLYRYSHGRNMGPEWEIV